MTSKETGKTQPPSTGLERDFAALADQWADENWYLPPGGDQSWRDREAQRLFGGNGEEPVNDSEVSPPVDRVGPPTDEADAPYEPGFRRGRTLGIMLPVLLAACAVFFVPIFMPQILTSDFWAPYEPAAPVPVQLTSQAAILDDASLRPAYDGGSDQGKAANDALPQQTGPAVAPIKIYRNTVLPNPRPAIITQDDRNDGRPAAPITAKVQSTPSPVAKARAAKSLPPIGAAYFASHAPAAAKQMADSTRPIGQAYFESHSPARTE